MFRAILLVPLVACTGGDPSEPTTDRDSDPDVDPVAEGPFWYGEVEPVVRENCVTCHQAGAIGPFVLDDYETAKAWAGAVSVAVTERSMPPWLVTDDGTCQTFAHSRALEDAEIELIAAWAEAGAPEGDPSLAVSDPNPVPPALDRVDLTVSTPTFVPIAEGVPSAEHDEYRCFLIEDPTDRDLFVTGFDVVPGNEAIVHHVLGMPVDPAALGYDGRPNRVNIDEMNGADGRDGWDCFGTAGGNIQEKGVPIVWAPGMGAVEMPDGIGVRVAENDVMVIQVHYNLVDPDTVGQSDQTSIRLRTETDGIREAHLALPDLFLDSLFSGNPDVIPPGESAYEYTFSAKAWELLAYSGAPQSSWDQPVELAGIMPHMHALGREQHVRVIRADGTDECLSEVLSWDFHWQLWYFYEQPVILDPEDEVEITCVWDTTGVEGPTLPGWGTQSEMCLSTLMLVP